MDGQGGYTIRPYEGSGRRLAIVEVDAAAGAMMKHFFKYTENFQHVLTVNTIFVQMELDIFDGIINFSAFDR